MEIPPTIKALLIQIGKLIGLGILMVVVEWLDLAGIIDRVKRSENLIQTTVVQENREPGSSKAAAQLEATESMEAKL